MKPNHTSFRLSSLYQNFPLKTIYFIFYYIENDLCHLKKSFSGWGGTFQKLFRSLPRLVCQHLFFLSQASSFRGTWRRRTSTNASPPTSCTRTKRGLRPPRPTCGRRWAAWRLWSFPWRAHWRNSCRDTSTTLLSAPSTFEVALGPFQTPEASGWANSPSKIPSYLRILW